MEYVGIIQKNKYRKSLLRLTLCNPLPISIKKLSFNGRDKSIEMETAVLMILQLLGYKLQCIQLVRYNY